MIKVYSRYEFLKRVSSYLPEKCTVAEIGVLNGDFSQQILDAVNPETLLLIDPFATNDEKRYGKELNYSPTAYSTSQDYINVVNRFSRVNSVKIKNKFSYDAVLDFENDTFNFIYLDASHLFLDVKRDLNDWLPKLEEGGIISGHDYINFDTFGVVEAVDEFCKEHNFKMIILNENGGDWALKKI